MLPILLLLASAALFLFWHDRRTRGSLPAGFPPGPPLCLPVVGSLPFLGTHVQSGLRKLRQKYGDVYHVYLGPRLMVVLNNYDLIKEAFSMDELSGRSELTIWSMWRGGHSLDGSPPGVIQAYGRTWTEQRRFALTALRDLGFGKQDMEQIIQEEVSTVCDFIESEFGEAPVDVSKVFNASVLSALWRIVAGERLDMRDPRLKRLIAMVGDLMGEYTSPKVQILINYNSACRLASALGFVGMQRFHDNVLQFAHDSIKEHQSTYQSDHQRDFIDAYLHKAAEEEAEPSSTFSGRYMELNLRNVLLDFFFAGSDTTSATLRWAVLFLANNPSAQARVQREMDSAVGRGRAPSLADRAALPYTEATVHEIQRRANIAHAAISHTALKDVSIGGHFFPAGTAVLSNLSEVMLDEKDFPQPKEFRPERFLDEEGKTFTPHPKVIPFGYGKRRCLGETLARAQVFLYVTGLLHRFTLERTTTTGEAPPLDEEPVMGISLTPKPFKVRMVPRN